MAEDVL